VTTRTAVRQAERARRLTLVAVVVIALAMSACSSTNVSLGSPGATGGSASGGSSTKAAVNWRADVVAQKPHDTTSFTEGLEIDGGVLYESSGLYGRSTVRAIDRASGRVLRSYDLPANMFAEGLTKVGDRLVVLTWQEHVALVLDAATFTEVTRLTYDAEGWGICALGNEVVTSDGSDRLTLRDNQTLVARRSVEVRLAGIGVADLNELECVNGTVYANVWQTDRIVRIDPASGTVTAHAEVPELRPATTTGDADAVLNGIAYDATSATFLLTGKRWPQMYEVRFVPA
jgi:glutamine cyclotransferase